MRKRIACMLAVLVLMIPMKAYAEGNTGADWYAEKADMLCSKLHEVVSFDGFTEIYTASEEIIALIDSWEAAMDAQPRAVNGYPLPPLSLISEFVPEMDGMPDALIQKVERAMASMLVSQINAMEGVNFLAASNIPTLSEGFIMPDGFEPCIVLYEYEEISVCVSFVQTGEGVVGATVQFASPRIAELLAAQ